MGINGANRLEAGKEIIYSTFKQASYKKVIPVLVTS